MASAEDIYKMWHQKNPKKFFSVKEKYLDEKYAACVGKAVDITYKSAKWEKKNFTYNHEFGNPSLYFVESLADPDEIIGKLKKISSLLGTSSAKPEMAMLGTVQELTYEDKEGDVLSVVGVRGAALLSTPDKKGLLILAKAGPVFVRGGKMRVEARGIVD